VVGGGGALPGGAVHFAHCGSRLDSGVGKQKALQIPMDSELFVHFAHYFLINVRIWRGKRSRGITHANFSA